MRRSNTQVFAAPAAIAALTVVGLLSALLADGVWDVVSWVTLSTAAGVGLWFGLRRPPHRPDAGA